MTHVNGIRFTMIVAMLAAALSMLAGTAGADMKDFKAGSLIIPMDPCWQPNNDPAVTYGLNITAGGISVRTTRPAGCDTTIDDQGIFHAYGLVYDLMQNVPVYWIIGDKIIRHPDYDGTTNKQCLQKGSSYSSPTWVDENADKSNCEQSQHVADFSVTNGSGGAVAEIYHNGGIIGSTGATVEYAGGPFIVAREDLTPTVWTLINQYQHAKIHVVAVQFSANWDKILEGRPPKIAVLEDAGGSTVQILRDYLKAGGLGTRIGSNPLLSGVFKTVTADDVINGGVLDGEDFQLMWAPHWDIEKELADPADRDKIVAKIRNFLEQGNAGFYECASIESWESSEDREKAGQFLALGVSGGGFLTDLSYATPRIETDGGTMDETKMVFEDPDNFLAQCAGWVYMSTGGHVHNFRPHEDPVPDNEFNSTVTRFIHDVDDSVITGYTGDGYSYYAAGRINGVDNQGYVSYLAGHRYIQCTNANIDTPPERLLAFQFGGAVPNPAPDEIIGVEVVHDKCTQGVDCPKASFDMLTRADTDDGVPDGDAYVSVDLDATTFDDVSHRLDNIIIRNQDAANTTSVSAVIVTFPNNGPLTQLDTMLDLSSPSTPVVVCDPMSPSPALCPPGAGASAAVFKELAFVFEEDITSEPGNSLWFQFSRDNWAGKLGFSYDVDTATVDSVWTDAAGIFTLDLSMLSYDPATFTFSGIRIVTTDPANPHDLDHIEEWNGHPAAIRDGFQVAEVLDVTSGTAICSPPMSWAWPGGAWSRCPDIIPVEQKLQFEFEKDLPKNSDIVIDITYTNGGVTNTVTNVFRARGGPGQKTDDGYMYVDTRDANYGGKKLQNVKIGTVDPWSWAEITKIVVSFDGGKKLKKIKEQNNGDTLCDNKDPSPYSCSAPYKDVASLNLGWMWVSQLNLPIQGAVTGGGTTFNLDLGPLVSDCTLDWGKSNTCGIRYVLNTMLGLQFYVNKNEYAGASPLVKNNIQCEDETALCKDAPENCCGVVYKPTYQPGYDLGHLRAYNVKTGKNQWSSDPDPDVGDAAQKMPLATARTIFTNVPGQNTKLTFVAGDPTLRSYMDPSGTMTSAEVDAVINLVRGRIGVSAANPMGTADQGKKKLRGLRYSTPGIVGYSDTIPGQETRDRTVVVGADDGMLHAFYAGSYLATVTRQDAGGNTYNVKIYDAGGYADGGKELWAYIPGSLLPYLKDQNSYSDPNASPAVAVDGSPTIADVFIDAACYLPPAKTCSGRNTWRTVVTGAARSIDGSGTGPGGTGTIFALDVTDISNPIPMWESNMESYNAGRFKRLAIAQVEFGTKRPYWAFGVSNFANLEDDGTGNMVYGVKAFALNLATGEVQWEKTFPYSGSAASIDPAPAGPAIIGDPTSRIGRFLVFGDFGGTLRILKVADGSSVTSFSTGNGADEPIGAGVSVFYDPDVNKNPIIAFGTGGSDSAPTNVTYHVFAKEFDLASKTLNTIFTFDLPNPGEKVWAPVTFDAEGNLYLGTSVGDFQLSCPHCKSSQAATGNFYLLGKGSTQGAVVSESVQWDKAIVGMADIVGKHGYATTADGHVIEIGDKADYANDFEAETVTTPVFILRGLKRK